MLAADTITDSHVRAAVSGGQTEREAILAAMGPRLRAMVIVRLAPTPAQLHAVDDISQQVLLAVSEGIARLQTLTVSGMRAFCSRIVSNKVIDYLRRSDRTGAQRVASLESSVRELSASMVLKDLLPGSARSALSDAARREAIGQVLDELGRIDERSRQVITMAFFDQLTTAQIGEQIGISRAAASMALIRAVRRLRRGVTGSSQLGRMNVQHP